MDTTVEKLTEYYNNPAVSQSQLKTLLISHKLFDSLEPKLFFEEKQYFIIGSAVDVLITGGNGEFDEKFYVSSLENKPSDVIKSIIQQTFHAVKSTAQRINSIQDYPEILLQSCNSHNYYNNWKDETRVNKIIEYWQYWEELKNSLNKTILSQEDYELINSIVLSLKENPYTRDYFQETISKDILYQVPIYFEYKDIQCKALLDMIIIDHENKTIQPIDIKTIGDYTKNFSNSLKRNRYDIQAAWYILALEYYKIQNPQLIDYEILRFKFIVESTINVGEPCVFTISNVLENIGKYGRVKIYQRGYTSLNLLESDRIFTSRSESILGYEQLIDRYKWYLENSFEEEMIYKQNQGHFHLDWSGII